jgi:hypothetical protein
LRKYVITENMMGSVRVVNIIGISFGKVQTRGMKIVAKNERVRIVVGSKLRGP